VNPFPASHAKPFHVNRVFVNLLCATPVFRAIRADFARSVLSAVSFSVYGTEPFAAYHAIPASRVKPFHANRFAIRVWHANQSAHSPVCLSAVSF
jgi:hypothetical protein